MRSALILFFAAAAVAGLPAQTFRTGVEGVRVDVLVTDGNRPVGGLIAADFELRDTGIVQRIDSINIEDVPLNVMLAFDTSASMEGAPLAHLKAAALALAGLLTPADRAAFLTFAERIRLRASYTEDRGALTRAIADADASGATSLHDAAYAALTLRDAQPGRALVLIFSDGDDTMSWLPAQAVLDAARRTEAVVYAVGLQSAAFARPGYQVDFTSGLQPPPARFAPQSLMTSFLLKLAEDTGGKYMDAVRSESLRDRFVEIVTEFRSRYLLTYTPQGVDAGGWHPLDVKLKTKKGKVTARRGYLR